MFGLASLDTLLTYNNWLEVRNMSFYEEKKICHNSDLIWFYLIYFSLTSRFNSVLLALKRPKLWLTKLNLDKPS